MKQYAALLVTLIFLTANDCYAFDLGVLENANKEELVLAVFIVDNKAALRQAEIERDRLKKIEKDRQAAELQNSKPIEYIPPKPRQTVYPISWRMFFRELILF